MSENIITIDLGGTKVLTALLNSNKEIIARDKIPTDLSNGPEYLMELVSGTVNSVMAEAGIKENDVKAICMGVPGTVDPSSGIINNAPNLGFTDFNIREALQKFFNIPVIIENDVNLGALGIARFEFDNKVNNMLVVFLGTGIGAGLILNGKIYRGSCNYAGEIGHMYVDDRGYFAGGGSKAVTFEELASRTAIVKAIKKDIKDGKPSIVNELADPKKGIKSKTLAQALKQKDEVVKNNLKNACTITGSVLANLVTLLNFDTIVLGGGVIEAMGDYMLPKIQRSFNKSVLSGPDKVVNIVATKLGDDAPLYGGIALAEEFLQS